MTNPIANDSWTCVAVFLLAVRDRFGIGLFEYWLPFAGALGLGVCSFALA